LPESPEFRFDAGQYTLEVLHPRLAGGHTEYVACSLLSMIMTATHS
jgi:hypothetical protein